MSTVDQSYDVDVNLNYIDVSTILLPSNLDGKHTTKINRMTVLARGLMPTDWVSDKEISDILSMAYQSVDLEFGYDEANDWANGFSFPAEVFYEDTIKLAEFNGNLQKLAEWKNSLLIGDRFSEERLELLWDVTDPDYDHLLQLSRGVPVWLDKDFVPTITAPPLSTAYRKVHSVINKLCFEHWKSGQAIILPLDVLLDPKCAIHTRISLSGKYGWVPKSGAREGRPTNNYSYDNKRLGLINTNYVRESVKEFYGNIELAQLNELMLMIINQLEIAGGKWEDIAIWKMDLKGAFALLNFKTDEIGLLTMNLTENLCFISLVGNFGLSQYPYIFGIISRVLCRAINKEITGAMLIFVDDFMGACLKSNLVFDMKTAQEVAERLLGSYAISIKKTKCDRVLDWIGWKVNLENQTVSIADHNLFKTLFGFFKLEKFQKITVREIQRLASWASRYSLICRYMKPFTQFLYQSIQGRKQLQSLVVVEGSLWLVIQLWQIFLVMSKLRPEKYAKTILSFKIPNRAALWLSYDASLEGVGFIIRTCDPLLTRDQYIGVVSAVSLDTPYQLNGDSGYQNTMEFIAILMGMFQINRLGYSHTSVQLIGDNTSSLHWCDHERFRGGKSNGSAIAYICQVMKSGNEVIGTAFLKGVKNIHCDKLSRGFRPQSLGYPSEVCHAFHRDTDVHLLLHLINPMVEHMDPDSITKLWTSLHSLFSN